jgi:3-phenylpropionate/trans-cinnamate dioxygenase ferredoxin subunit
MDAWTRVADEAEVFSARAFEVGGRRVAVFRTKEGIFALDDICSHEYSLLSEGEVWDGQVYCPKHGSCFSLATGAVEGLPATGPVAVWKVKLADGGIWVVRGGEAEP